MTDDNDYNGCMLHDVSSADSPTDLRTYWLKRFRQSVKTPWASLFFVNLGSVK